MLLSPRQVLDGARMRMARKPSALARELLRNFPKGRRKRGGRRRRGRGGGQKDEGQHANVQAVESRKNQKGGKRAEERPAA